VACHGRNLEGGAAGSLVDGVWKFGGEDAQIAETIREGRKGTAMAVLQARAHRGADLAARGPDPPGGSGSPRASAHHRRSRRRVIRSEKQAFRIEVVARDLETPWGLAFLPDGRLLVTERPGRLRIVEKGHLLPEPVADTPTVWNEQDGGLLDVEVHPRYARTAGSISPTRSRGPAKRR
jgi:glucose/arabinose dehydrogenase